MRDYAIVSSKFWTGKTGKYIRRLCIETPEGHLHRSIASYLVTAPTSNMIGLYYLPLPTLCYEVGSPLEGALKVLRSLSEGGFAFYDEDNETVWIPEMPKWQLHLENGEGLKKGDNRVKGVNHLYQELPKCSFLGPFFDKWAKRLRLEKRRKGDEIKEPVPNSSEAPSKPLRSQDQDQDQEQDQEHYESDKSLSRPGSDPPKRKSSGIHNEISYRLAQQLHDRILDNKSDYRFKKDWRERWAQEIDRMIRLDNRSPPVIDVVIEWCQADNIPDTNGFCWAQVILSASKLRSHFDKLEMRMKKQLGTKMFGVRTARSMAAGERWLEKHENGGRGQEDLQEGDAETRSGIPP